MSSGSDDVKQLQVRLAGDQPAASAERPWDQLQQVLFSSETAARSVVPQAAESNRLQQASLVKADAKIARVVAKISQSTNAADPAATPEWSSPRTAAHQRECRGHAHSRLEGEANGTLHPL